MDTGENFEILYSQQRLLNLEIIGYQEKNPSLGIFRDLYINLDNLLNSLKAEQEKIPGFFIFTDVLIINNSLQILKDLLIYARRIEVLQGSSLSLWSPNGGNPSVTVFAQEIIEIETNTEGKLKIVKIYEDDRIVEHFFEVNSDEGGAAGLEWEKTAEPKKLVSGDSYPELLYVGEPLYLLLMTLFQLGSVISADNCELAMSQFKWITSLASSNVNTFGLAADAHSFALNIKATQAAGPNAILVPILDLEIYSNDAQAYMHMLERRNNFWNIYKLQTDMNEQFLEDMATELALYKNEKELDMKLEQQAKNNYDQVMNANKIAANQLSVKLKETLSKKFDFQEGIEEWKRKNITKETFNLIIGIGTILIELPALISAGPELAAIPVVDTLKIVGELAFDSIGISKDIFKSESEGAEESKKTEEGKKDEEEKNKLKEKREETIKNIGKDLYRAGNNAKDIYDSTMKIGKISNAAEAMLKSADNLHDLASGTVNKAFLTYDIQGLDLVTGGSQDWDNLALDLDHVFESFPDLSEIKGGREYQLELRKLIVCGKNSSMAKLSLAKAKSEYATAIITTKSKQNSVNIVEQRVNRLKDKKKKDDIISQIIFYRLLDAKRSVYTTLESYRRAYQYFTLANNADLPILPKLNDVFSMFENSVAQIFSKKLQVKELVKLNAIPQSMNSLSIVFNDEDTLENLRNHGITSFEISTNDSNFRGLGRVRFNCVRIFLYGIDESEDKKIKVDIATNGIYLDINPNSVSQVNKFVSLEVRKSFIYTARTKTIIVDGDIAARYANDYFMPTPFTTWTMQVGYQSGEPLECSSITGFEMTFYGEATALKYLS